MSNQEIEFLRSTIGEEVLEVDCPTVRVLENSVAAIPSASVRLKAAHGFLVFEVDEKTTLVGEDHVGIECRPRVRKSAAPDKIPYIQGKEMIVGPCNIIELQSPFRITSIVVFQYNAIVNVIVSNQQNQLCVTTDKQVTFYSGESRPLSTWSANSTLYISRDLGLLGNSIVKLEPRLILK